MDDMTPEQVMTIYGHLINDPTPLRVVGMSATSGVGTEPRGVLNGVQVPLSVFNAAMDHHGELVTWRQLFEEAGLIQPLT